MRYNKRILNSPTIDAAEATSIGDITTRAVSISLTTRVVGAPDGDSRSSVAKTEKIQIYQMALKIV